MPKLSGVVKYFGEFFLFFLEKFLKSLSRRRFQSFWSLRDWGAVAFGFGTFVSRRSEMSLKIAPDN